MVNIEKEKVTTILKYEEAKNLQADPDCPMEQDNKVDENQPPEATEFGQSEQEHESRMIKEMDHSDSVGVDIKPLERDKENIERGGHSQTSMKSILNFRDHKGRTPLHIAAIWGNKEACETMLYLKANCLIEDADNKKPYDYVEPNSSLADLFKNWMPRTTPPNLTPFGEAPDQTVKGASTFKQKMENSIAKKQGNPVS